MAGIDKYCVVVQNLTEKNSDNPEKEEALKKIKAQVDGFERAELKQDFMKFMAKMRKFDKFVKR